MSLSGIIIEGGITIGGGISIGATSSVSFTITSARLSGPSAYGATFSSVTTSGFTIDNPNIGNDLYPAYSVNITDDDSDIIAAFNTAGELYTQEYPAYIWTVSWGPGTSTGTWKSLAMWSKVQAIMWTVWATTLKYQQVQYNA